MSKTILYIHQSSELYGSDKTLFYLVDRVNKDLNFKAIVILPEEGPLKDLLEERNVKVIVFPVIKVSRSFFNLKNIISLPFQIVKTTSQLRKQLRKETIDIVHSNTLAVLLGAFFSKRYNIKHIWHVHEIIRKPIIVKLSYRFLVNKFSDVVVFNSKTSKDFLCSNNKQLLKKALVNLNGLDRNTQSTPIHKQLEIRKHLFAANEDNIVIALIGRINKWKGQQLLLKAFSNLNSKHNNLKLIFVGSAPKNQEFLLTDLKQEIKNHNLNELCKIIPFQDDIWPIWDSIDLAIVPSTEPEPFGLVALEAMLAKKPVVAANHGGLTEIIIDNETGYFFKPNNSDQLSNKIHKMIICKDKMIKFGLNGNFVAKKEFSLDRHVNQFLEIYQNNL